jgi:hypothetical protein
VGWPAFPQWDSSRAPGPVCQHPRINQLRVRIESRAGFAEQCDQNPVQIKACFDEVNVVRGKLANYFGNQEQYLIHAATCFFI